MKWSLQQLTLLYKLIKLDHKTFAEAGQQFNCSPDACRKKFSKMDWEAFQKDPSIIKTPQGPDWTQKELTQLYLLRHRDKLSFAVIAKKLNKTIEAVQSRYYRTKWDQLSKISDIKQSVEKKQTEEVAKAKDEIAEISKADIFQQLSLYLVELARHNIDRLDDIKQASFLKKTSLTESTLPAPFTEIKKAAKLYLERQGYSYPEEIKLGAGTYFVVGDSHGKQLKRKMFALLKNMQKDICPKKIIHVGHALDDDNDMSYLWDDFDNLIVLARQEELKTLVEKQPGYEIARTEIKLGNLSVCNQDMIQDYVSTGISSIGRHLFPDAVIVNCHRHEFDTRCISGGFSVIASPGCLCEKHIVKTVKQMDFTNGMQVKVSYPESYIKYRRMKHMYKFWEQGLLIVNVMQDGSFTIVPCRINITSKGYTTSYFNKIYTSDGIFSPDEKHFINADAHCPNHDIDVLSIQDQFCKLYKPDRHINLGDQYDNRALNHHEMTRNGWAIASSNALDDMAHTHYLLRSMRKWAKDSYLLLGNHERFTSDFIGKLPQLKDILSVQFVLGTKGLKINVVDLKDVLRIGKVTYVHGDFKMFGAKGGSKVEKFANTFGQNTVLGDVHYPSIRMGAYSVGMSGKIEQGYNEKNASRWLQGFAYCNVFEGIPFISIISLPYKKCNMAGKVIKPEKETISQNKWWMSSYDAEMSYTFLD